MEWNRFKSKMEDLKIELDSKVRVAKARIHWEFIKHEDEIPMLAAVIIPSAIAGIKAISVHQEKMNKKCMKYDPAIGLYNHLKHPLNNNEIVAMLTLQRELGITQTEALSKMGLLKN